MKYLIQNRKEFAISIGFFVMTALNLGKAIMTKEIDEDLIIAFIYAFFGVLAWFYNMPTSEENCRHTGEMRLEKIYNKEGTDGEDFFEEFEEIEEQFEETEEQYNEEVDE